MPRLEIRTDGAALHPTNDPVVARTREDQRAFFESDQVIVLVTSRSAGPTVASRQGLRFLAELHHSFAEVPGVYARRVRSLATLIDPRPEIPVILSSNFLDTIPDGEAAHAALLARVERSPLGPGLFLSQSGLAAALYVPALPTANRGQLVTDLQRTLDAQPDTFDLRLGGPVTAEVMLGRAVLQDLARLVPLMVLVTALLLFACLRSAGGVLVPLVEIAVVLVCTLGAMGHLGVPVTLVTAMLPVLLMTVTVTDDIHVLERFRSHLGRTSVPAAREASRARTQLAMQQALAGVGRPIVLTSLTTAIGFLSFVTASMPPVRHFGLFVALGVLLAMALSFTFVPAFVVLLPPAWLAERSTRSSGPAREELSAGESLIARHESGAALAGLLLLGLALPGLARLSVKDSWVENFDPESELVLAERDFNRHFWGSYRFDVVLEAGRPLYFMGAEGLRLVAAVADAAAAGPHVGGVASPLVAYQIVADLEGEAGRVYELPTDEIANITRLLSNVSRRTDLDQVLGSDGSRARVRLFVKSATYERADELRAYLERELAPLLGGNGVSAHFSGDLPLAHAVVGDIVSNMLRSVGWTTAGVALMLLAAFRSFRLAAITIAPLALSIPLMFGFMGYAGMPIGIATSMFSAVTIGVAVDFAIHFTHGYRTRQAFAPDHRAAVVATFASAGRAIRWNAIVVALGTLVLVLSALKPNRSLGLLLAASMLTSWASTALLLPWLLRRIGPAAGGAADTSR